MFALMHATRAQALHLWSDPATGLRAVAVIHNEQLGPAMGGCRYLPYADDETAIADALQLARAMSYKAALAGLPVGGGKAVILRGAQDGDRAALFQAFGRFLDTLGGRLVVAVDSGTSIDDMDCIARSTRHVGSTRAAGDPAPVAALGVLAGLRATAQARLGSGSLEGLRVAVQGLGHVGHALAEGLHAAGAELLVSDLDPDRVRRAVERFDAWPVAHDALLSTPCDLFVPCGVGPVLNAQSVMQLRCAAVAGSANNPLTTLEVADQLQSRGILYAPDTIINAGGLIHVALTHRGEAPERITAHLTRIPERLTEVFGHAQAENRSPARVAQALAERLLYGCAGT
nr:Glu/Leu/Phe/Val dehydrogenase dimerization domain-containing protein [uncultured Pseudomonas sp.]